MTIQSITRTYNIYELKYPVTYKKRDFKKSLPKHYQYVKMIGLGKLQKRSFFNGRAIKGGKGQGIKEKKIPTAIKLEWERGS